MKHLLMVVTPLLCAGNALANQPTAALRAMGATWTEDAGAISSLKIDCTKLTGDDYRLIGAMTSLKSLSISGRSMTDGDLKLLAGLVNLESILINGTQITDDGYRHFAAFPKLKRLALFHPSRNCADFTGAGLIHLKALPKLERLTFAGATAGDAAYRAIAQLDQLQEFREWHNWETDAGKRQLQGLKNLKSLTVGQRLPRRGQPPSPSFDNATLAFVAQMKSLERLALQEARLSYAGLAQLGGLPNLKQLSLRLIDIPAADVKKLRATLPDVEIRWEPLSQEGEQTLTKKLKLSGD